MNIDDRRRPDRGWSAALVEQRFAGYEGGRQFLRNKRQEWEEYRSEVTAFELRKNLPVL